MAKDAKPQNFNRKGWFHRHLDNLDPYLYQIERLPPKTIWGWGLCSIITLTLFGLFPHQGPLIIMGIVMIYLFVRLIFLE